MTITRRLFITLFTAFVIFTIDARAQTPRASFVGTEQPLTAPSSRPAADIARDYLTSAAAQLSLATPDLDSLFVAKQYKTDHNGVTHIVYRQRFQGIDVANSEWITNLDRDGSILNAGGSLYGAPPIAIFPDGAASLRAVRAAAAEINPKLAANFRPTVSMRRARRAESVVYSRGDFGDDFEGRLVWYPVRGSLQLAWLITVTDEDGVSRYDVAVEDATGAIIGKQSLTYFQSAKGLIYDKGSPQPTPPGIAVTSPPTLVDRVSVSFAGDPVASPKGWVAVNETSGNNTIVGENRLGLGFIIPTPTRAPNADFSFPLSLGAGAPNPLLFADAINTNLFYWINQAHDLHYQYGFNEAAGNFQSDNLGRGGVGGDPILAYTHFGSAAPLSPALRNAFFSGGSDDGSRAEVAMYLSYSDAAGLFTDGSLDATVIIHEYTHGVSTRLVSLGYTTFQGASMGEAWSDFYALEYLLPEGAPPDGIYPVGEYFEALFGNGIRTRPFSTRKDVNPLTYENLGAVNINGPEVHADGEIWVEALLEARANLIAQFGEKEGRRRIRILVLDGMKLSVPAPSMVDMRDAILLADRVDFKGESQSQLWAAFAKRGLGTLAYSPSGDSIHVVSSFDLPSPNGKLKFFDDPLVAGETVRVLLADSNNTEPAVKIQLTGSSGDLENLTLRRVGSIYFGSLPSSRNVVTPQNGTLNFVPGDAASAYYVDLDTGSGKAALVQTTVLSRPPYALSGAPPSFSFSGETRIASSRAPVTVNLPFEFPFFSNKYRNVTVYPTGALGFGFSAFTNLFRPGCTDVTELARFPAVAPLFANLTFGIAQQNEGIFLSTPGRGAITFRWAAETLTPFTVGQPVNFAVTLTDDGVIQFSYGPGNNDFTAMTNGSTCGQSPVIGISNGHEAFTQTILSSNLNNGSNLKLEPPFNFSSVPVATVERPARGETVRGVLTVSGIAYDPDAPVSRVDIYIDGIERALTTPNISRTDFCSQQNVRGCPFVGYSVNLNLGALNLAAGAHNLRIRVTNTRGSFADFPATPVSFTVDSAPGRLPTGAIEAPAAGATISGATTFRGYAYFDDLRVSRVDLLIDGLTYPGTSYGVTRTDICNPLPTPKPLNCNGVGWTLSIDTRTGLPPLPDGAHSMQLRILDETGRFTLIPDAPISFTVKNGPQTFPVGVVTAPKPNDTLSGTVTVSGYAYSPGGRVIGALILVDGRSVATARYGDPRPDDCAKLTGVTACPNIGFSATFDSRTIPNGPHVLGVFVANDQGLSIITPQIDRNGMNIVINNP